MTFLNPWDLLWGAVLLFWPITLGVIVLSAWFGYRRRGVLRWVPFSVAGLLAGTFLSGLVRMLYSEYKGAVEQKAMLAHYSIVKEILAHPRTVQGQTLPAGTEVLWRDETFQDFERADLPSPAPMLNAVFQGRVEHSAEGVWIGNLAKDAIVDGWPCASGNIRISPDFKPLQCVLGADRNFHGRLIPAGTQLSAGDFYNDVLTLTVPARRSVALPEAGLVVPGGGGLYLHANGAVDAVATADSPLRFRGVPLLGFLKWIYAPGVNDPERYPAQPAGIEGQLGGTINCERQVEEVKQGKSVLVPWLGREVEIQQSHVFDSPPSNTDAPTVTLLQCDLLPVSSGFHVGQQK